MKVFVRTYACNRFVDRIALLLIFLCGSASCDSDNLKEGDGTIGSRETGGANSASCTQKLPIDVKESTLYDFVPACEDFGFDADGNVVLMDGSNIVRISPEKRTVISPIMDGVRGIRVMPNEQIAIANSTKGTLMIIDENGSTLSISGTQHPNGITFGKSGDIYATTGPTVTRVILGDEVKTETVVTIENRYLDGITFSHDYRKLYVNDEGTGEVFAIPMQEDGEAAGEPVIHYDFKTSEPPKPCASKNLGDSCKAMLSQNGTCQEKDGGLICVIIGTCESIDGVQVCLEGDAMLRVDLDGMTADVCGNIYVCEMTGIIWRITPDGEKERVASTADGCTSVNFGSGVGIWKRDHLYVGSFLSLGLHEFPVKIEGKWEPYLSQ